MHFDGAAYQEGVGAGVVFNTPQQDLLPYSFSLSHKCSNNVAEYQTHKLRLETAADLNIPQLEIYGDSQLVIRKLTEEYEVRKPELIPYHGFGLFTNSPTKRNTAYDRLSAARKPHRWRSQRDRHPTKSSPIHYFNDTLFRRSFGEVLLRCLSSTEAAQAMNEAHSVVSEPLYPTKASWPFDAWGLDMVGPMLESAEGHVYILAATDYFSKWAEAVPLLSGKKEEVVDFIPSNLIYRYGVPRCIIINNEKSFNNKLIAYLCAKFKFKTYHLSMYYS
ncbi:hypothetical protein LIER_11575 [Lithospermum erythrorhizon]|uniref:Integrase catalytic domain-containing protein n=1 Tax=Lithospermum erythrorhizon TaxID=34254 RepID=A0AAV3PSK8_LITER